MKRRLFYFLEVLLLLSFSKNIYAQQNSFHYLCGHDIVLAHNENKYPGYREVVKKTFADAKLKSLGLNTHQRTNSQVYKIPVVMHVVWREEVENLHDSVLINQIDRLNEDFRLLNDDAHNLREEFKDRQSDTHIEFELVEIRRVQTTRRFTPLLITLPDEVKRSAQGGSDAADPEKFLNIWICRIQPIPLIGGQVFGYAYPPANLPHWPAGANAPSPELDGVVVDFRCIGSNNPNPMVVQGIGNILQNGRTLVHEIGHYLGLRHIWGDGGGIFGGNSCNADDGVEDTPNQGAASSYNCNKNQNTCEDDPDFDMVENYMDYSDQECQNTFTHGQAAIMRAVLEGPRRGLWEQSVSTQHVSFIEPIEVFPNPVKNSFFVKTKSQLHSVDFILLDLQGRVVYSQRLLADTAQEIVIDNLTPGMYIWNCADQNGKLVKY